MHCAQDAFVQHEATDVFPRARLRATTERARTRARAGGKLRGALYVKSFWQITAMPTRAVVRPARRVGGEKSIAPFGPKNRCQTRWRRGTRERDAEGRRTRNTARLRSPGRASAPDFSPNTSHALRPADETDSNVVANKSLHSPRSKHAKQLVEKIRSAIQECFEGIAFFPVSGCFGKPCEMKVDSILRMGDALQPGDGGSLVA